MRLPLACFALLLTACPQSESKPAANTKPAAKTKDEAKPAAKPSEAAKPAAKPSEAAKPAADKGPLATVSADTKYPLPDMLGKAPGDIQPRLGDPTGKGMSRKSCLRFLPEKTWFECSFALQRYTDASSTYEAITLTFEDGLSAGIAFEGIPGEGDFDPKAALAHVGVTLPGEPKQTNPEENVTLWSWFNGSARLLVHGKQYRVEVSTVDGTWASSRVEFILNHPLTDEQKTKVRQN